MNTQAQVGLPARKAAVRLLSTVLRDRRPFEDAFAGEANNGLLKSLTARDRALVHLIVATTLRRKGQLEDALSRFLQKPLPNRSGNAKEVLLTGAAQLLFLQTPPHAAIDLALRTADLDRRARGYKKVINAVLRRVSENRAGILESQDAEELNTPEWLWRRWSEAYGGDTARAIARAHATEPSLDLSVKNAAPSWGERLDGHVMPTGTVRLVSKGRIENIDGYDEGAWWVQDAAAALPAKLLGNVEGRSVLDLCAAPGGKTAQLAAAGANVTAVDRSEKRIGRISENLKRLGLDAQTVAGGRPHLRAAKPAGRHPARCPLFGHRHDPAARGHPPYQDAGDDFGTVGPSAPPAQTGTRYSGARRTSGVLHLLAGTGRRRAACQRHPRGRRWN